MARILVVDDEPIIAMTVAEWLADLDHEALGPASTLAQAQTLAAEGVDAVVLDVTLGTETTARLAERLSAEGVPFVVATGHDPGGMDPVFARGLLLPKPFMFETFTRIVARLLAER